MAKRQGNNSGGGKAKKFKAGGFIDPNTTGIYATCNRGREQQCRKELTNLFNEKIPEYFDLEGDAGDDDDEEEELSIEDQIQKELNGIKEPATKEILKSIELGCECLVFFKTRRPIQPEVLVERICRESLESTVKTTRYTQKLSPVTYSVSPTMDELKKLCARVMKPHFHKEVGQKPLKFAIQISKRNFNTLERSDMIQTIAECVGREHGHSVDLKKYDKLILVECYKTNIGMSVVNNYLELEKFNLQQIFEKHMKEEGASRVKSDKEAEKVGEKSEKDSEKTSDKHEQVAEEAKKVEEKA